MKKLTFKSKTHSYFLDGKPIPSLSEVLNFYFGKHEDYTNGKAAERGTKIHKACEYWIKNELDIESLKTKDMDWTGYINAFKKFFFDNPHVAKGKPTTEKKLFITLPKDIEENYMELINWMGCGMRLDLMFKQTNTVIEIKTGIPAKPYYWGFSREDMQLNTQIAAVSSKRKPSECWTGYLLYIKRDGKYQAIEKKFDVSLWYHFQYAWHGWYNLNYNKETR